MVLHFSANSRLSIYLKQAFARGQAEKVVATPQVMTFNQFLDSWQEQLLLVGDLDVKLLPERILTSFEASKKWEELLAKNFDLQELLNSTAAAKQMYQAWVLWIEYGKPEFEQGGEEWQVFATCAQEYQAWLQSKNYLDEPSLNAWRLAQLAAGKGSLPSKICWHGFDEYTPFMQEFQRIAQEVFACEQEFIELPKIEATAQYFQAEDLTDELQQVANFCVEMLQSQLKSGKKIQDIRIGVLAPKIADIKQELSFWLDDLLFQTFSDHPLLAEHSTSRLYNFSLGEPLLEQSFTSFIWQTIRMVLQEKTLPYADFSPWLCSAFMPGLSADKFKLDKDLRRKQWSKISWQGLVERTSSDNLHWPKLSAKFLTQLENLAKEISSERVDLSGFVNNLVQILQLINDSLTLKLSSDEFQQLQRLHQAVEDFAKLQSLNKSQQNQAWLQMFYDFSAQIVYQAESKFYQPIQIIGMLEAGGLQFDAVWVLGLDDEAWPRQAQPNPFLPLEIQRNLQMPRAEAKRELEYARKLTARIQNSAPELVFSYAKLNSDAQMSPSPLLAGLQQPNYLAKPFVDLIAKTAQPGLVAWQVDNQAPPVPAGALVRGGTAILDAQIKCPLMAFVDYRLGAKYGIAPISEGLESANQGTLVHKILEDFWREVKTSPALQTMADEAVDSLLNQLLEREFELLAESLSPAYLSSEKARIFKLLRSWLDLEKQRPEAFEVVGFEQKDQLELAGIKFSVTLDRIDKTPFGKLIIDYKTGRNISISGLFKEPLGAPQLAIYLHQIADEIAGIGYGKLNSAEGLGWSFVTENGFVLRSDTKGETNWSEKPPKGFEEVSWQEFLDSLKKQVVDLAEDIAKGNAQMKFNKQTDLQYAGGLLALRLPEVLAQQAQFDEAGFEELE